MLQYFFVVIILGCDAALGLVPFEYVAYIEQQTI